MKKFIALVVARNKEFYRDKATLLWTFIFPFLVLLGFAYGSSGEEQAFLRIGVASSAAPISTIETFTSIPHLQLINYDDSAAALKAIERHQLDLYLKAEPRSVSYWINPDAPKAAIAERLLKASISNNTTLDKKELTGQKTRYVDWLVPGMIGMNLMFASLYGVGYVVVRYRKNGVLKRLRATPLTSFEFLLAQIVSRTLLLLVTTSLTILGAKLLIGFQMAGSWIDLMIFVAVGSSSLIALGMLVAARLSSEEVADGILNVMTWPMIFLSGIWFSLEGASGWVLGISRALPLTHLVNGLRAIMLDGAPLSSQASQLFALLIAGAVLLAVGSLIFKWR